MQLTVAAEAILVELALGAEVGAEIGAGYQPGPAAQMSLQHWEYPMKGPR